ncbi:ABC transporter permease [Thermophilibacter mediterraneus]|uniref:ABC transporter permease n=1 Tax=Thermophilibacter mediterraneus TaxID=1871031 RepID=UPI002354DB71|nr:ABC transporter permease [Thermophilibacter mediterraneus]
MPALLRADLTQVLRNRGIVIWVMAFPIILATIFMFVFGDYSSGAGASAEVGLVEGPGAEALSEALDALAEGDDPLLTVRRYANEGDAEDAVLAGDVCAYVTVGDDGSPRMLVSPQDSGTVSQAVVQLVLDRYQQVAATLATVAERDPAALASPGAAEALAQALAGDDVLTERLSVLRAESGEFQRYYYAMLGFSSLMGAQVALLLVTSKRADGSEVGARRQVSATRPALQLASALLASWLVCLACQLVALAFIRFVVGVPLGGREGLAALACAACALVSCAIGAAVGALPGIPTPTKDTLLTIVTMGLSVPAGLFGTPSLELSDWLWSNLPLVQAVNPAAQVGEAFYRLTFYDSLEPFAASLASLVGISTALLCVAALFMRRQRYARL